MNVHSLLYVPGDSLSTMVKHFGLTGCPVEWLWWHIGAQFPYVFFRTVDVWTFKYIYDPTLLKFAVPVLGGHEKGFYGVGPFEMHLDPKAVACPFELPPTLWMKGTTMEMFMLLLDPLLLSLHWLSVDVCLLWMLYLQLNLFCRVLRAFGGILQACRAFLVCSISLCSVCYLVQTSSVAPSLVSTHFYLLV